MIIHADPDPPLGEEVLYVSWGQRLFHLHHHHDCSTSAPFAGDRPRQSLSTRPHIVATAGPLIGNKTLIGYLYGGNVSDKACSAAQQHMARR